MSSDGVLFKIFSFGGVLSFSVAFVLLGLFLLAAKLAIICGIVYFFLAAAGIVPVIDVVPFVPYV